MTKEARIYNGEKTASSISGAGKTGQPHGKEWNQNFFSHHIQKLIQNGQKTKKKVRPETIKLLEENIGRTLFNINCSNIFLDLSPKAK